MAKYLDLSAHVDLDVTQLLGRRVAQPCNPAPVVQQEHCDKKCTTPKED